MLIPQTTCLLSCDLSCAETCDGSLSHSSKLCNSSSLNDSHLRDVLEAQQIRNLPIVFNFPSRASFLAASRRSSCRPILAAGNSAVNAPIFSSHSRTLRPAFEDVGCFLFSVAASVILRILGTSVLYYRALANTTAVPTSHVPLPRAAESLYDNVLLGIYGVSTVVLRERV